MADDDAKDTETEDAAPEEYVDPDAVPEVPDEEAAPPAGPPIIVKKKKIDGDHAGAHGQRR